MDVSYLRKSYYCAEGFRESAEYLKNKMYKDISQLLKYGPAFTSNLAFACELYLKQLLIIENKNKSGHELLFLYKDLSNETRKNIEKKYVESCSKISQSSTNIRIRDIEQCLTDYNRAFEDWRYWFEGNKESQSIGWIDFSILVDTIREFSFSEIENLSSDPSNLI